MKIRPLAIINWIAFAVTLAMNALSNSPGFFQFTSRDAGESRAIFFLPAGYVFAIWGVIYLGLGAYLTYQARPVNYDSRIHDKIGVLFLVTCLGNIGWLFLFLNNLVWESTIAIVVLLVALLAIYVRLDIGRTQVNTLEKWAVHIPFSIYLGWVSVATIANFSAALYVSGNITAFLGITADIWAVIMMAVAAVVAGLMLVLRRDVAFALVVVWALIGIYNRPFDTAFYQDQGIAALNIGLVNTGALIIAIVITIGAAARLFLNRPNTAAA